MPLSHVTVFVAALWIGSWRAEGNSAPATPHNKNLDAQKRAEAEWSELAQWLRAGGAEVNAALQGGWLPQSGMHVRGILTSHQLQQQTVLLSIPRKLWIVKDNFPEIFSAALPAVACNKPDDIDDVEFRLAASLALEMWKGKKSTWQPWVKLLPDLLDFHQYHPIFMDAPLRQDFEALPVTKLAAEDQKRRYVAKACFEAWRNQPSSPVRALSWKSMLRSLVIARTRAVNLDDQAGRAIIPGADMMNTVDQSITNTDWHAPLKIGDSFIVKARQTIKAGTEIQEAYCIGCANMNTLTLWGVYLEDNSEGISAVEMDMDSSVDCHAKASRGASLQEVTEASLKVVPGWHAAGWRAPRCQETLEEQGPLRCSLARLAWEYCATQWAFAETFAAAAQSRGHAAASLLQVDIDNSGKMMRRHGERPLVVHGVGESSVGAA